MTDDQYPTARPTSAIADDTIGFSRPYSPEAKEIPWIDGHQHTQTLSWEHYEKFDASGARAVVMIAASYFQVPYRPIRSDDWRFLWDDALRRAHEIARGHFFDVFLAMGIHLGARIEDVEAVLDVLPDYCALDEVVAIGETGIDPVQSVAAWPLDEQRDVLAEQMHIARDEGLPVLLHTPGDRGDEPRVGSLPVQFGRTIPHKFDYEGDPETEPQFDVGDAKLRAAKLDVEVADEVGLPHEQVVLDHASSSIVDWVMAETDCYLSFSLVREAESNDPEFIASVIEEYGSDRIMVDTDLLGGIYADDAALTMRRLTLDLLRLGVDPADVKQIVYGNQRGVFGLEYDD